MRIYIYIYIERERERCIYIYIYICVLLHHEAAARAAGVSKGSLEVLAAIAVMYVYVCLL